MSGLWFLHHICKRLKKKYLLFFKERKIYIFFFFFNSKYYFCQFYSVYVPRLFNRLSPIEMQMIKIKTISQNVKKIPLMVWMYSCREINECLWVTVCTMGYPDHFGALKDRYGKYGLAEISADTHEWSWQMHSRYPVSSISLCSNGISLNSKTLTSNVYESKSLKPQKFKFNDKFPFWVAVVFECT